MSSIIITLRWRCIEEGVRDMLVSVVADLSALDSDAFWTVLDHRSLDASL